MTTAATSSLSDMRALKFSLSGRDLVGTVICILIASIAAFAAKPDLGEATSALIFVLGIFLTGALFGLLASLIAAVTSALLFNFYLTEPILTFRLATGSDVAPLVFFSLAAVVAGIMAGRLKDRAQAASNSNDMLSSLLSASEALQSAVRLQDIGTIVAAMLPAEFAARVRLFSVRDGDLLPLHPDGAPADFEAAARHAVRQQSAGPHATSLYTHRLEGNEGITGVIVSEAALPGTLDTSFLTALGNLVTIAIERATLSEAISESRARARTEELKTALLSSVSHDFRTPLTAISASASSLIDYRPQLDQKTTDKLLRGIVSECERLNRYTANLLEMSRLEAGQLPMRTQALGVFEMLSTVLKRVRPRAGRRKCERFHDDIDLAVVADAALFDLVLTNVLDNAILYSDDGSKIRVEVHRNGANCRIAVSDEGRGIPQQDLDRVFERFYRVPRTESSPRGSGLGLAIAKGFVEALGGSIEARTPGLDGRGTSIIIILPLAETGPAS